MIRPFQPKDAPLVLALVRELLPLRVESEASVLRIGNAARCWVAEDGGGVVGFGRVQGRRLWLGVAPAVRGRGIGAALWARIEEHADEPAVCWTDDAAGVAFAEARGFRPTATRIISVLDLAAVDPAESSPPAGVHLVRWPELDAPVDELEAVERADSPDLAPQGSFVAVSDGRAVAYALLTTDERGLAENEFTATLPDFRGRGLATLCKLASIRWAKANGIHTIVAGNDGGNAPMLAINRKLGYRRHHERTELART